MGGGKERCEVTSVVLELGGKLDREISPSLNRQRRVSTPFGRGARAGLVSVRACLAVCAVVAGLALVGCTSSGTRSGHGAQAARRALGHRVLFSTDFALGLVNGRFDGAGPAPIDDAYAVALGLANRERLDVRGIVVTYGNDHQAPELRAARRAVGAIGAHVPVVGGATEPLANPPIAWFDGTEIRDWCVNDGVRFMARELREHGPLTVFAIGPLTDIACLIRNFPREARRIERVVALMGSRRGGGLKLGATPVPDLNFTLDPVALEILLKQSRIPATFMLFEVTSTVNITAAQLAPLAGAGRAGAYYAAASAPNVQAFDGFQPFDAHTVQWVINPRAYRCFDAGWRVVAGQPSASPRSGNVDAFRRDLPGRRVRACDAFASDAQRVAFADGVVGSVDRAAAAWARRATPPLP
jgi:inosine-uridine nucleoside N-ribohydrolase